MRRGGRSPREAAPPAEASPRVRIGAGRWKGRALEGPPGARPTSGRARGALFSLLGARIPGGRWLELYAGSGAVGLEAVSRGAVRAVLVERDPQPLSRSLAKLGASPAEARVVGGDAGAAIAALSRDGERFDVVFADPPYAEGAPARVLAAAAALLAPGGVLVVQADAGEPPEAVEGLRPVSRRAYGRNVFHFYEMPFDDPAGKC